MKLGSVKPREDVKINIFFKVIALILKEQCYHCGFAERRVTDYKTPLLLNFKDGNRNNYLTDNLELLCYNDYFLLVADPLTPDQVRHIEDNTTVKAVSHDWDLDEAHLENMKALGLLD